MSAEGWSGSDKRIEELERENQELRRELERALAEIERLKEALEEARRCGRRQAAPYSTGKRKAHPKRPGRKPGEGVFRYRQAPPEE